MMISKKFLSLVVAFTVVFGLAFVTIGGNFKVYAATTTYSASAGFSAIQGKNQWYYQKLSGGTYTNLATYDSTEERWKETTEYPWVSADAQHPENTYDSVRKWVAPGNGTIDISGSVHKGNNIGDGIVATIKKNDTQLWSAHVTRTTNVNPTGVTGISVAAGDAIYFIVGKNGNMDNDHTFWDPTIVYTSGGGSAPTPGSATALETSDTMTIDGYLNESAWDVDNSVARTISGIPNNTVNFGVTWDSTYLYVGIKALDSSLYGGSGDFDDDSFDIYIDGDHNKGTSYDSHDRMFQIFYNNNGIFEKNNRTTGVLHATAAIAGGFSGELAIPWSNLGITPSNGTIIGFDVANNDDDDGGDRDSQTMWHGTGTNYLDTSAFGEVELSATVISPPTQMISILTCGATANDGTDDLSAINTCASQAKAQGKALYVPAGNFILSDVLTLDGVSMFGAGINATTLTSTDPSNGSIDIEGDNVTLSSLKHVYATVVPRDGSNLQQNSITVIGATHFTIDNVYVYKASGAGILIRESENGTVQNNKVDSTNADGIHMTLGSSFITVDNNYVTGVGDDTIAVVSYLTDGTRVHDITIQNNDVGYHSLARGITVVGGVNVTIANNSINNTDFAGIYISAEAEWNTYGVDDVTITGNTIDHCGLLVGAHPNVLIYASQGSIDDITFNYNLIENAVNGGIGSWGDGSIGDLYFNFNTVSNSGGAATQFVKGTIHLNGNTGF